RALTPGHLPPAATRRVLQRKGNTTKSNGHFARETGHELFHKSASNRVSVVRTSTDATLRAIGGAAPVLLPEPDCSFRRRRLARFRKPGPPAFYSLLDSFLRSLFRRFVILARRPQIILRHEMPRMRVGILVSLSMAQPLSALVARVT